MLTGLRVILVHTRFPENIGMAARACANMGCSNITLVRPRMWDKEKAIPLATPKGLPLLEHITVAGSLEEAIADSCYVLGTTARRGGWRQNILHPQEAARRICERIGRGESTAIVFGPEDRGLENSDITHCQDLVTIPTYGASSLNLAQAVLIMLYECTRFGQEGISPGPKTISHAELSLFLHKFKESLLALDCLHGDNVDYFFLPWQRLFGRMHLTRKEYDALMGLCRQIANTAKSKNIPV